jgi:hypothetical protein
MAQESTWVVTFRELAPLPHRPRQTAVMSDVVYMVRARTRAACQRALDQLCERMDAEPATAPTDAAGSRWLARAVPAPEGAGRG